MKRTMSSTAIGVPEPLHAGQTMLIGAVVLVLLLLIAFHGVGGDQPSLSGLWRSNDPVQIGMNPPRTITFSGNDTVVLGLGVGVAGQEMLFDGKVWIVMPGIARPDVMNRGKARVRQENALAGSALL